MKKLVMVFCLIILISILIFGIFNFNDISAASVSCSWTTSSCEGDIVLSLSGVNNAHAAKGDGGAEYPRKLCCDGGTVAGTCDSSNTFVKLSSDTNAHGAVPTHAGYSSAACYDGASCHVCDIDETALFSLSSNDNAHFAEGDFYGVGICCDMGTPEESMCPTFLTRVECWDYVEEDCTWMYPWVEERIYDETLEQYTAKCCPDDYKWDPETDVCGETPDLCHNFWSEYNQVEEDVSGIGPSVRYAGVDWTEYCADVTGIGDYGFWFLRELFPETY